MLIVIVLVLALMLMFVGLFFIDDALLYDDGPRGGTHVPLYDDSPRGGTHVPLYDDGPRGVMDVLLDDDGLRNGVDMLLDDNRRRGRTAGVLGDRYSDRSSSARANHCTARTADLMADCCASGAARSPAQNLIAPMTGAAPQ